ncbi:hypothetical protein [Candidatus Manganitrophus noduliformans]|uniref:Uncharacterized protein n=1 Tax=Candidatus Manganitrophus noduliformans TaxID=2606439 RepID=A0A7X6IE34_9BACT|nr:hypothetical protein [Candidatus Manganitrophus noduliformans]NKE73825.1 hypothetical protein [Candidatus Manganitrophus noduliformans]
MFDLYFGFGTIVLFAFFYLNLAWALKSAHTPPPRTIGNKSELERIIPEVCTLEQGVPVLNATLRVPQMKKQMAPSNQ